MSLADLFVSWKRFRKSAQDYGFKRAMAKASGRLNLPLLKLQPAKQNMGDHSVSVVGCGQAAYATICFFLQKNFGNIFLDCYDPNPTHAQKLKQAYGSRAVMEDFETLIQNPELKTLVVASNHASHTDYTIAALERGIDVFCEKPISVSFSQLQKLEAAIRNSKAQFHSGFNRPFAPAIKEIRNRLEDHTTSPIHFNAVVFGHHLEANHWYNHPEEGTRISGNLGHWIDLAIHFLYTKTQKPEWYRLELISSNDTLPTDENISLIIQTNLHDLITISLSSLHEPFGGIREQIFLQTQNFTAHIDDFRNLHIITDKDEKTISYKQKDPGHEALLIDAFSGKPSSRNWEEVRLSTLITLHFAEMARTGINHGLRIDSEGLVLNS